jgi:predicted metal-dependent hydrolase
LRIDPEHGLEAVVPERYSEARARRDVEAFIETRLKWIDRSLAEVTSRRTALGTDGRLAVGGLIPYAGRPHSIVVGAGASIAALNGEIQIPAPIAGDPEVVRRRLLSWLRRRARAIAEQMISVYAAEMKVTPTRLRIGDQSTRWGSASGDGTISLSWRLVLAPPSCFEAVVVHELAHLRANGHGARFRAVVERHLPDEAARMRQLQRLAPALSAVR